MDIPATLQSSLLARLDRLGEAKAFAQVAAVIGREFSRKMVQLVIMDAQIGLDDDALDDAFVQLTDTGLVVRSSTQSETYIFKHALVQDAASHSLLRATRSHLHRSVVHVLRDHFPNRISTQPELAARHAEAGGMVDDAIAWYEQASEQARSRSEHEEALLHLHRALDLLATQAESIERDQREIALQQTLAVELFVARGYSVPEAIAALERVVNSRNRVTTHGAMPVQSSVSGSPRTRRPTSNTVKSWSWRASPSRSGRGGRAHGGCARHVCLDRLLPRSVPTGTAAARAACCATSPTANAAVPPSRISTAWCLQDAASITRPTIAP